MDKDDDFTFCQVGDRVDEDGVDEQKVVPDVSGITLRDELANGVGAASDKSSGVVWKGKSPSSATPPKQSTVGSLTFNVIDASRGKVVTDPPKQTGIEDSGKSVKESQEQKITIRKPAPRAKVPFEKGYSQMDWLKLTRTHPDMAGLKGQSNKRLITLSEVKQHQTEGSMWTVLKGHVYNISPYMKFHPGGVDMLMKAVGKDSTSLFNKYHAWVNFEFLLEKCLIGILDDNKQ
ncbi:hypothetical protein LguiB_023990 [Lonicera macranthoides]